MTSLCVDTRGLHRRQDLLFADYVEWLAEQEDSSLQRLVAGGQAGPNETVSRWKPGGWANSLWESRFLEGAEFDCFHCFRPLSQVPWSSPRALVTVLAGPLPQRKPGTVQCRLVVPSPGDRRRLIDRFDVPPEHVFVLRPPLRHGFLRSLPREKAGEKGVLFLTSSRSRHHRKILDLLKRQYDRLVHFQVDLDSHRDLPMDEWEKMLSQSQAAFYLVDDPFDWGTLAMECTMRNVPVVFADDNLFLQDLWKDTGMGLRNYLLEHPEPEQLKKGMEKARKAMTFPTSLDSFFGKLVREAPVNLRPDLRPGPSPIVDRSPKEESIELEGETTDCSP